MNNAQRAAGRARPGELLSLVLDGLAGRGLDVQAGEGSRLAITWPGAQCQLAVSDWGAAEWEYWPQSRKTLTRGWPLMRRRRC